MVTSAVPLASLSVVVTPMMTAPAGLVKGHDSSGHTITPAPPDGQGCTAVISQQGTQHLAKASYVNGNGHSVSVAPRSMPLALLKKGTQEQPSTRSFSLMSKGSVSSSPLQRGSRATHISSSGFFSPNSSSEDMSAQIGSAQGLRKSQITQAQAKLNAPAAATATGPVGAAASKEAVAANTKAVQTCMAQMQECRTPAEQAKLFVAFAKQAAPAAYAQLEQRIEKHQVEVKCLHAESWKGNIKHQGAETVEKQGYDKLRGQFVADVEHILGQLSVQLGCKPDDTFQFLAVGTPALISDIDAAQVSPKMKLEDSPEPAVGAKVRKEVLSHETQSFLHMAGYALLMDSMTPKTEGAAIAGTSHLLDTEFYTQHIEFSRNIKMTTAEGKAGTSRLNQDAVALQWVMQSGGFRASSHEEAAFEQKWNAYTEKASAKAHPSEKAAMQQGFQDVLDVRKEIVDGTRHAMMRAASNPDGTARFTPDQIVQHQRDGTIGKECDKLMKENPHAEATARIQYKNTVLPGLSRKMDQSIALADTSKDIGTREMHEVNVKRLDCLRNLLYDEGYMSGNTLKNVLGDQGQLRKTEKGREALGEVVRKETNNAAVVDHLADVDPLSGGSLSLLFGESPQVPVSQYLDSLAEQIPMDQGHKGGKVDSLKQSLAKSHPEWDAKTVDTKAEQEGVVYTSKYKLRITDASMPLLTVIRHENPGAVPELKHLESIGTTYSTVITELEQLKRGNMLPGTSMQAQIMEHLQTVHPEDTPQNRQELGAKYTAVVECVRHSESVLSENKLNTDIVPKDLYVHMAKEMSLRGVAEFVIDAKGEVKCTDDKLGVILKAHCGYTEKDASSKEEFAAIRGCITQAQEKKDVLAHFGLTTGEGIRKFDAEIHDFANNVRTAVIKAASSAPETATQLKEFSMPTTDEKWATPLSELLKSA